MSKSKELLNRCLKVIEDQILLIEKKETLDIVDQNNLYDYVRVLNTMSEKDLTSGEETNISELHEDTLDEIIESARTKARGK